MRVKGRIGDCWAVILIDTGSTHNFIDPAIVCQIRLRIIGIDIVMVQIANGDRIFSEGRVKGLSFSIQHAKFTTETYILLLAGCDLNLGVVWFQTLGTI